MTADTGFSIVLSDEDFDNFFREIDEPVNEVNEGLLTLLDRPDRWSLRVDDTTSDHTTSEEKWI